MLSKSSQGYELNMAKKQEVESREHDFPEEIWRQIMCFLPVRSLLVIRSIAKSFRSIVDDPKFISFYYRTFPNNLNHTQTIFHTYADDVRNTMRIKYEISECSTGYAVHATRLVLECNCVTGSLDGLLLLHYCERCGADKDYNECELWNPCTRQVLSIMLPRSSKRKLTGLAYDSSSQDYKVLSVVYHNPQSEARVYSVKTGCWTTIETCIDTVKWICCQTRVLFLADALVWFECRYRDAQPSPPSDHRLVRFEVGAERIQYMYTRTWPVRSVFVDEDMSVMLDGGSTLGVFGEDFRDGVASIWAVVMDGDVFSLNKRYSIPQYKLGKFVYPKLFNVWVNNGDFTLIDFSCKSRAKVWTCKLGTQEEHWREYEIIHPLTTLVYLQDQQSYVQTLIRF